MNAIWRIGESRPVIFVLAFLSFACLLGHFYGLWDMQVFASCVLPPSTMLLLVAALRGRRHLGAAQGPYYWIVEGAIGGVVAAIAYDLFRLPFVLAGTPLFNVFPRFGEVILSAEAPHRLVHVLGWAYHLSNGAALGIMFLSFMPTASRRWLFFGAIAWALVEAALLLTTYADHFGLRKDAWFVFLTASAHLVFGLVLGCWCALRATPGLNCPRWSEKP
jgi:hypothetical protein